MASIGALVTVGSCYPSPWALLSSRRSLAGLSPGCTREQQPLTHPVSSAWVVTVLGDLEGEGMPPGWGSWLWNQESLRPEKGSFFPDSTSGRVGPHEPQVQTSPPGRAALLGK